MAGQLATILSLDNRLFWLAAFIAFLALAIIALHERRHAIRRLTCGARARALGASIVLPVLTLLTLATTVVIFGAGHRIYACWLNPGPAAGTGR